MGVSREPEDDPPAGVIRWLLACDESGIHAKSQFYGFGTLWMKWDRRGDFQQDIRYLRALHRYQSEAKWTLIRPHDLAFYKALVEYFFGTRWLCFHSIVVPKVLVDRKKHDGKMEVAWAKHFTMLLTNKVRRSLMTYPDRLQSFRIWVDPLPSSYKKADERLEVIANNVLAKVRAGANCERVVDKVITHDSKETPAIQLCDVLLGAVVSAWSQDATGPAKVGVAACIAEHLGWPDLRGDTFKSERKFNIWMFHDPQANMERVARSRKVELKIPYP